MAPCVSKLCVKCPNVRRDKKSELVILLSSDRNFSYISLASWFLESIPRRNSDSTRPGEVVPLVNLLYANSGTTSPGRGHFARILETHGCPLKPHTKGFAIHVL